MRSRNESTGRRWLMFRHARPAMSNELTNTPLIVIITYPSIRGSFRWSVAFNGKTVCVGARCWCANEMIGFTIAVHVCVTSHAFFMNTPMNR